MMVFRPKSPKVYLMDMFFGIYYGNVDYVQPAWTMQNEFLCSFIVMVFAQFVVNFKNRWVLYIFSFLYLYLPSYYDEKGETNYDETSVFNKKFRE